MGAIFEWADRPIPGLKRVKAQAVGEELERIRRKHRSLTPKAVVNAARPKDAVLHKCFEWNSTRAGELYREQQARHLITSVRVVEVEDSKRSGKPARVYVNVEDRKGRRYVPVHEAMGDAELREQILGQALSELKSWQSRYAEFSELAKVFRAIEATSRNMEPNGQLRLAS